MILGSVFGAGAWADIVCRGEAGLGAVVVRIADDQVTISGAALEVPAVYTGLQWQWDGHETGLLTAPGLAISYEDWYGCIHNAQITANFRTAPPLITTLKVNQCAGGSTPDTVCHVPGAPRA